MSDPIKNYPFLKNAKMSFSAPNPTGRGPWCKFGVDTWNGNPRFVLQTNDPNEKQDKNKKFGKIEAAMDLPTFMAVIVLIKQIAQETLDAHRQGRKEELKEFKCPVLCNTVPRGQGGPRPDQQPQPVLETTFIFGRDAQGVLFVSNISADESRMKVKVPFSLPDKRFHVIQGADRQPLDPSYLSAVAGMAFANIYEQLVPYACMTTYEAPSFGGGGGGNNRFAPKSQQNTRYSGGANQAPARSEPADTGGQDFGDDIPF